MLSRQALKEILELTKESGGSFVILEKDQPRLVISDFYFYEKLANNAHNTSDTKRPEELPEIPRPKQTFHYLVTGGAGTLGVAIVTKLANEGHTVSVIDNFSDIRENRLPQGVNVYSVDLRDEEGLSQVFDNDNFDAVLHLAQAGGRKESVQNPEFYFVNNVEGGINLLKMMAKYNVPKMVYRSTSLSGTPSDETKLVYEEILSFYHKAFNINSVTLRLPFIAGKASGKAPSPDRLYDNPVEAVIDTAAGAISCLDVPSSEPGIEVISLNDAVSSILFALQVLDTSSGSMVYKVDAIPTSINGVIQEVMEFTDKMIPTSKSDDIDLSDAENSGSQPLTSIGWHGPTDTLNDIVGELWGNASPVAETAKQAGRVSEPGVGGEQHLNQPISLSDLLSGKYTPFIKPHNS